MGSRVFLLALGIWMLPAMIEAGVIRELNEEREEQPCRNYTLYGLVYFDCSNRELSKLPNELNYEAQVVDLSNNAFESFPPQLENFSRVEILDLSSNRINQPIPRFVQDWKNLFTLNLSNNNFDIWINSGYGYNNIKRLDLSKNKINTVEEGAFNEMPRLNFLDFSENRIKELALKTFAAANNLETLILSRNYFSVVPSFQSPSLKILRLSSCQITNLNVDSLAGMTSLLELDLSINQIEYIPDNFASNSLQELDLSYNEINSITDRTFSSLPHLAVLDMRGNEFKEVWSTSHFASNPFLREVFVKGNRWSCEGFSVNLLLTYEFLTKDPPKVLDRASLICYSPSNVTQMSWQQAYIQTWHPNDSSGESFTMIAVMIGIIIGILMTSFVCRGLMALNKPEPPNPRRQALETTALNLNGTAIQPRAESVSMRIPLHDDDLPPSYDEALLMPRLNASFHSLPDFVDEEEAPSREYRRSRSIGDLTESRTRAGDRRSVRRTIDIRIN